MYGKNGVRMSDFAPLPDAPLKMAVLISGRGSNMEALLQACQNADFPAETALVLSNRPAAGGLEKASSFGIRTAVVDHKEYDDKASFEAAMQDELEKAGVNVICLAGFMRLLSAEFVEKWPNRILNIHPSLLPKYKGLDTHERALAAGDKEAGCTVHFVRPAMDSGPIILQRTVPVLDGDDPDRLAARVLKEEHAIYPEAVKLLGEGRLKIVDDRVEIL